MTVVSLDGVSKAYEPGVSAVSELSLSVDDGELFVLLGPSGCGKTTTMRMVAGLIQPTAGDILFNGRSILPIPPEKRGAVMVFQQDALFPFKSVADNVAFGLRIRPFTKPQIQQKVKEALAAVQLAGFEEKRPSQLSGGQRQRVALARALVIAPQVLLLDEPLSQLDPELRAGLRKLIRRLQQQSRITTIFVTHDQEEAMVLADRIGFMVNGRLHQVGSPEALFNHPIDAVTARFFGCSNFVTGRKQGEWVETKLGRLRVETAVAPDGPVQLAIRPEAIEPGQNQTNSFSFVVHASEFVGNYRELTLERNGIQLVAHLSPYDSRIVGESYPFNLPCQRLWAFPTPA